MAASDTIGGSVDGAASSSALDGSVAMVALLMVALHPVGLTAQAVGEAASPGAYESSGSSAEHRTGQVILR